MQFAGFCFNVSSHLTPLFVSLQFQLLCISQHHHVCTNIFNGGDILLMGFFDDFVNVSLHVLSDPLNGIQLFLFNNFFDSMFLLLFLLPVLQLVLLPLLSLEVHRFFASQVFLLLNSGFLFALSSLFFRIFGVLLTR